MKYHKIPKVSLNVCTAEQMVAYNMARRLGCIYNENFKRRFSKLTGVQKSDVIFQLVDEAVKMLKNSYEYNNINTKYNVDYIICAFRGGIEDYINQNTPILWYYEDVGKIFPANYLEVK